MKKDMIKKLLVLAAMLGLMVLLTGCDNRKCVKSHKESAICTYSVYNGRTITPIVVPCSRTVCDEYEETE